MQFMRFDFQNYWGLNEILSIISVTKAKNAGRVASRALTASDVACLIAVRAVSLSELAIIDRYRPKPRIRSEEATRGVVL
jgi:hypothetical protein